MKEPLKFCVNNDGNPVSPPSWVLCRECLDKVTDKLQNIADDMKKERKVLIIPDETETQDKQEEK